MHEARRERHELKLGLHYLLLEGKSRVACAGDETTSGEFLQSAGGRPGYVERSLLHKKHELSHK